MILVIKNLSNLIEICAGAPWTISVTYGRQSRGYRESTICYILYREGFSEGSQKGPKMVPKWSRKFNFGRIDFRCEFWAQFIEFWPPKAAPRGRGQRQGAKPLDSPHPCRGSRAWSNNMPEFAEFECSKGSCPWRQTHPIEAPQCIILKT